MRNTAKDSSTIGQNKKPTINSRLHGPNTAINSPGVTSPKDRLHVPQTALQRRRNDVAKVNNIRQQLEQKRNMIIQKNG